MWPAAITATVCLSVLDSVCRSHPSCWRTNTNLQSTSCQFSGCSPGFLGAGTSPVAAFRGPDYVLQPGNYDALFEVRQGEKTVSGPVARLEVILHTTAGVTSITREMSGLPDARGRSRYEDVPFTSSSRSVVETPVFPYGSADLSFGDISIWRKTYVGSGESRAIAWVGSIAGILMLTGLWLGFRGPGASKTRRTAGLVSTIYFSVLAGWVVNILVHASPDGIRAPISEPLLPVTL